MLKQVILKLKVVIKSLLYMSESAETPCVCLGVTLQTNLNYLLI